MDSFLYNLEVGGNVMAMGEQLKKLRNTKGLKVKDCANYLGVSPSTYREWENGRSINGEPYSKIAQLFEVSLSELFGQNQQELARDLHSIEKMTEELLNLVRNTRSHL